MPTPEPPILNAITLGFEFAGLPTTGFRSSQTLLDYDVVLWDPSWTLDEYSLHYSGTYQGRKLLNQHDSALIVGEVARRRQEMSELLKVGGTVVVFVSPPEDLYIHTGEKQHSGTGRNRQTTEIVTSFSLGNAFPIEVEFVAATGSRMEFNGSEPFGAFWRAHKDDLVYRAYMKQPVGEVQAVVNRTERAVASVVEVGEGSLLLLPDIRFDDEKHEEIEARLAEGLSDLISAIRGGSGPVTQPTWAEAFKLPGEQKLGDDLTKADQSVARALERRDKARSKATEARQRKLLFTGSGSSLEGQVRLAFEALGFTADSPGTDRVDLVLTSTEGVAVVEVKGVTKSAKESHAAQLEKWVSTYYEAHGQQPKAILVVNTFCETPLTKRVGKNFPNQMLGYAEAREHCLLTGVQLLGAYLDGEANPEKKEEIRRSILDCVGVYDRYADYSAFLPAEGETGLTETSE